MAKCLTPSSFEFFKNLWKLSEIFGNLRNSLGKRSSDNFCTFLKIFGNLRKCSEMLVKLWKPSGNFRIWSEVYELFKNIPISHGTLVDWKLDSRILICNLYWYYAFCTGNLLHFLHWCYSLTALLSANQNWVIFSCMLLQEKNRKYNRTPKDGHPDKTDTSIKRTPNLGPCRFFSHLLHLKSL